MVVLLSSANAIQRRRLNEPCEAIARCTARPCRGTTKCSTERCGDPEARKLLCQLIWCTREGTTNFRSRMSPHRKVEHFVVPREGRSVQSTIASQDSVKLLLWMVVAEHNSTTILLDGRSEICPWLKSEVGLHNSDCQHRGASSKSSPS